MKKAALVLPLVLLAGCATDTAVHPLGHNKYLLCDTASQNSTSCDGANPEKGIAHVCPRGQAILNVEKAGVGQGVIVTCGAVR